VPSDLRSAGRRNSRSLNFVIHPDAGVAFLVSESREVMNVRQASQYLGISPDTLYRYITEGEIPAFKLGNRWKLRKTILDRWMERKMTQATARRR